MVGFPSSFVFTSHLPKTPSGISEKNTLTGAAVHRAKEPRLPTNKIIPTKRTIIAAGIWKYVPKILKISKIPFEKFPFKTSVGTTKPTATAPRIYMIPTAIVAPIIVRTNVLLPPLTSLIYTPILSPPPTACKIHAIVMKKVQLKVGIIDVVVNSCAGSLPKPNTTTKAKTTKATPINKRAPPAKLVTFEIHETPLIQTHVINQNNRIEITAIILVLWFP